MMSGRWSIGERLAAGFLLAGAVIAALLALIGWRLAENDRSSLAVESLIARTDRIDEVERAVLVFAISTRDALREHTPQELQQFAASESRLGEAVQTLQRTELDDAGRAQARALGAHIAQYAAAAKRAVAEGRMQAEPLSGLRTRVLGDIRQMLQEHGGRVAAGLHAMEANRRATTATLAMAGAVTCVLFVVIGFLTVRSIRRPARKLVEVAAALRDGRWQPALALRSRAAPVATRFEMSSIAEAFATAAAALELREQRLVVHGAIAEAAGSSLDRAEIADRSLRAVLGHVGAEIGVLYCVEPPSDSLVPVAAHATATAPPPIARGEGIVGQCARDAALVVVRDIPPDSAFVVKLGYDEAPPRTVAAVPIAFNGELMGVMLVASLRELQAEVLAFLGRAAAQVGVGLANARAYLEVQELLARVREQGAEIQTQNDRLQAQAEEIQAQNEELQTQNEELQAQSDELQAQSEEIQAQNAELQRQGAESRDRAEALRDADERKNQFLGVLAHELRNPLTPISNCVELLKRSDGDAAVLARAEQVLVRQVRHMTRLIDDLLDITRISRGKIELQPTRLNLVELVQECADDQRPAFERHGIRLEVELPHVPLYVEGDHTRLCQVFLNLLANAVKFCNPGTCVRITLTLDARAGEVAVHVADDGIGIARLDLTRIFEPFVQADSELVRTKGGLGLGLALAKGLVELHGGGITARSEGEGRGAEFIVTLPLAEARDDAVHGAPEPQASADQGRERRVLVIDDNADAADSLAELLSLHGCEVKVAYTARSGLEAAQGFRPDVVLCDVGLPEMDGYAFAREARRDPLLARALLIALTGYGSAADQSRAAEAGFDLHVTKPPDVAVLLEAFRNAHSAAQAG